MLGVATSRALSQLGAVDSVERTHVPMKCRGWSVASGIRGGHPLGPVALGMP